jgi:hypothetical protein
MVQNRINQATVKKTFQTIPQKYLCFAIGKRKNNPLLQTQTVAKLANNQSIRRVQRSTSRDEKKINFTAMKVKQNASIVQTLQAIV